LRGLPPPFARALLCAWRASAELAPLEFALPLSVWQGKPDEIVLGMKRELMAGALGRSSITDALRSDADAAALEALWAEVRRCHSGEAQVDYDACLAALGGGEAGAGAGAEAEAEAEALSELSFMAALGEPEAEEGSGAGVRLVQPPAWALRSPVGIWGRP